MKKELHTIYLTSTLIFALTMGQALQAHADDSFYDELPAEATTVSTKAATSHSSWALGLSTLQWNESLTLQQGANSAKDTANYSGLAMSLQKEWVQAHWGWNVGGFIGTGRASGGGNSSTLTYQKDQQAFTIIGATPRAFYRVTGRVNLGMTALVYSRSVDWPTNSAGVSVDASKTFTMTALLDMNLRLSNSVDFYQGLGPLEKSGTFWKIGLAYRF